MAPHSSTLAWKISWMEKSGGLQSMVSLRVGHDWATSLSLSLSCIGEGNGNPLQCSCLENPRDGGAWWAAISGDSQSCTWLSNLAAAAMLLSKYKREPKAWNKHAVCYCESEATSRCSPVLWVRGYIIIANTIHLFRLNPCMVELDSGT